MYKHAKPHHCDGCPAHSSADPNNPHVCKWDDTDELPKGRQKVIKIVQRLMHNNPHPWCGFDRHFRLIVVRAAARAAMGIEHGNEERYHDSQNQPANFRRSRAGETGSTDQRGSDKMWSSPLHYLASLTEGEKVVVNPSPTRWRADSIAGANRLIIKIGEANEYQTEGRRGVHDGGAEVANVSVPAAEETKR